MKYLMLFAAIVMMACNSCVPTPAPAPPTPIPTVTIPDAGPSPIPMGGSAPVVDAGPEPNVDPGVRDACANAAWLGCSEALDVGLCRRVTQRALAERLTVVPLACMVGAKTKADMQRCGFIGCK